MVYGALLLVILSGAYMMYEASATIYVTASDQAEAQGKGRIAQTSLAKHLRMTESFQQAGDYSVNLRADINDDNLWDKIEYYTVDDILYRRINDGTPALIMKGLRNEALATPIFSYFDLNGASLTTDTASRATKTHKVEITLIIDSDPNEPPEPYILQTRVSLRNKE
jgi:hypothetical protein